MAAHEEDSIQHLVVRDVIEREAYGIRTYGKPLYTDSPDDVDGDPLHQAYREALDLCIYLRWQLARREEANGERQLASRRTLRGSGWHVQPTKSQP
jgi:hypothetical protein